MAAAGLTAAEPELLALVHERLGELLDRPPQSTLDAVLRHLFNPADRERLTVSAFGSAL